LLDCARIHDFKFMFECIEKTSGIPCARITLRIMEKLQDLKETKPNRIFGCELTA
jgi:hypothetical protein